MKPEEATEFKLEFVQWESRESEALRSIRFKVFVDEQKVPAALELDETDFNALHVLARDGQDADCGTARMFVDPEDSSRVKIGRMAVLREFRRSGCGSAMIDSLLREARRSGYRAAVLSAQFQAVPFYRRFGFKPVGEIYDEAGIPHQRMELILRQAMARNSNQDT